jgi:hypothetical protein
MKQTYNVGYLQTPSVKHLANVKQALADTGLASLTTPNEMLPALIEEGVNALKDQILPAWEKVIDKCNIFNIFSTKSYQYLTKNQQNYYYYSDSSVYHMDPVTGETTEVISNFNKAENFFEASDGSVFVSTNNASWKGMYKINGTKSFELTFRGIPKEAYITYFYEASDGVIYFYGSNGNLYKIIDYEVTLVHEFATNIKKMFEYKNYLYFTGRPDNVYTLYCYDGSTVSVIYETTETSLYVSYDPTKLFISSSGNHYMRSGNKSILKVQGPNSKVIVAPISVTQMFEDGAGNIYLGYDANSSGYYLYLLKDDVAVQLTDTYSYRGKYVLDDDGILYCCVTSKIIKVEGENCTVINQNNNNDIRYIEGKIYVGYTDGLYVLNGGAFTKINSSNWNSYKYIKSKINNNVYFYSPYSGRDIVSVNGDETITTKFYKSCRYCFQGFDETLYFTSTEQPTVGEIIVEETENGFVQKIYKE